MKNYTCRNPFRTSFLAVAALAGFAHAGTVTTETTSVIETTKESKLSGNLSLEANSHFISYGLDVWEDGSSLSRYAFNPSLSLTWELPGGLSATIGTWWDVNSKGGGNSSPIGGRVQEIDIWYGLSYTVADFTVDVTYNQWFYGGTTEDTIDLAFSYDTFLSPSLTLHHRFDPGDSGGSNGTIAVLGLSHSIEAGPVTISFPFNLAYFFGDNYHPGSTDDGFGYGSLGVNASIPLSFISDDYGDWSINAGLTYYVTSGDVVGNDRKNNFLTANVGVSIDF